MHPEYCHSQSTLEKDILFPDCSWIWSFYMISLSPSSLCYYCFLSTEQIRFFSLTLLNSPFKILVMTSFIFSLELVKTESSRFVDFQLLPCFSCVQVFSIFRPCSVIKFTACSISNFGCFFDLKYRNFHCEMMCS